MAIGFFGGAFDPFHIEHGRIAEAAMKELNLSYIVLVPSYLPPHKDSLVTPFADRVEMLKIWTEGKEKFVIDTLEAETGFEKNCSYEIIPLLKQKYGSDCVYLIGGDSMTAFHTWVKPERIAKEIRLAVVAREGFPGLAEAVAHAKNAYGADIAMLSTVGCEVSSGEIRARLELGLDVSEFLDKKIINYINGRRLYRFYATTVQKLRASVKPSLFAHCARTAVFAARYASLAKVGFGKAFLAGLLHDCAKEKTGSTAGYPTDSLAVVHQYIGAEVAQKEYGIGDKEILDAIACHTTGKPAMTALDKLIYLADKLEDGRDFAGVNDLRGALREGFDQGFAALLEHNADYLARKGIPVDGLTNECLNYYNKETK